MLRQNKSIRFDFAFLIVASALAATNVFFNAFAQEEDTQTDKKVSTELAQGPYLEERTKLKARIEKLKADGVGIKPYQDALSAIDESIAAKEPDEQIQKSVERLNSALDRQMQSKAAITSNSYYHVHGSTTPGHSAASSGGAPAAGGSAVSSMGGMHIPKGVTPETIQKLLEAHPEYKQKYEDYKKNGHL